MTKSRSRRAAALAAAEVTAKAAPGAASSSAADGAFYPPVAFCFSVSLLNSPNALDSAFQEVSGIGSQMETMTLVEGGENRFVHQLPKSMKAQRAVLKRGIAPANSPLVGWCKRMFEGGLARMIEPSTILVSLRDADQNPVRSWVLVDAWPAQWDIEPFGAARNEVAVEKIELCYAYAVRTDRAR